MIRQIHRYIGMGNRLQICFLMYTLQIFESYFIIYKTSMVISSSTYQVILVKIRHNLILEHIVTHLMCHPMKFINKILHFLSSLLCKCPDLKLNFPAKTSQNYILLFPLLYTIIPYYTLCLDCSAFKEILKIRHWKYLVS